jgi:hypothetical protein
VACSALLANNGMAHNQEEENFALKWNDTLRMGRESGSEICKACKSGKRWIRGSDKVYLPFCELLGQHCR